MMNVIGYLSYHESTHSTLLHSSAANADEAYAEEAEDGQEEDNEEQQQEGEEDDKDQQQEQQQEGEEDGKDQQQEEQKDDKARKLKQIDCNQCSSLQCFAKDADDDAVSNQAANREEIETYVGQWIEEVANCKETNQYFNGVQIYIGPICSEYADSFEIGAFLKP